MKLLAIDPANETGYAISRVYFGTWNLKKHADESAGIRLLRFQGFLKEICELQSIDVIGYEKPGGRNYRALINHSKLAGEIEKFCEDNCLQYKGYSAAEIKKFATGKGNANKPAMIQAAQEKLDYTGENENEADALWILELMKSDLNLAL